eukprot:TRINITY_DN421_c0_g1_i1.p1 TRINITY_DN421_c0_g1~~TRINITY_DN421_c0_g1_i1.p1  ORF type:complete len:410 (+),score=50.57 TRINITY_DN421_c0_g1_i1:77-1306(+)
MPKVFLLVVALFFVVGAEGLNNGVGLTPPMGWTTWCTDNYIIPCYDDFCNEKEIKSIASAMANNGMKELGYNYVILDDCWAGNRTKEGNITADQSRFPSGMKNLADYVHKLDLKLGLYTDAGEHTCRDNRPGSWPHYQQDAWTYADWGVDYVKMDWCNHPGGHTAQELYKMMSDALNATGQEIFFNMCEWGLWEPWEWGPTVSNSYRIGPDHLPLWWTPETSQDPGQGQGTSNIIEHLAGKSKYAGPGGWNDPDYLMIGIWIGGLTETDWRTSFNIWCICAAPLIVATDIRNLGDKQILLNAEAIAVNQDPLGVPGDRRAKNADGGEVWTKQLSDGSWAVVVYCSNFLEWADIAFEFDRTYFLNWPIGSTSAKIRDLWQHKDIGTFNGQYTASDVAGHESLMFKVTPVK